MKILNLTRKRHDELMDTKPDIIHTLFAKASSFKWKLWGVGLLVDDSTFEMFKQYDSKMG